MTMMNSSIYNLFCTLRETANTSNDSYSVNSLPNLEQHKIGISTEGYPMFFVHCSGSGSGININLELISILFNQSCILIQNNNTYSGNYTIISLKTEDVDMQKYFLDTVFIVIKTLPSAVNISHLKKELEKLIQLFSSFTKPPVKTIQGLWAELLVIEQSHDPEYLIRSWHIDTHDKFDFNDGIDKIEVKSTTRERRIHQFSLGQLNPNNSSKLLIASILITECGVGKSVYDLIDLIALRLTDVSLLLRISEVIAQTIGTDYLRASEIYFDYSKAIDSLSFYDYRAIPSIPIDLIPSSVSNIKFDCDLTIVNYISEHELDNLQSNLFNNTVRLWH